MIRRGPCTLGPPCRTAETRSDTFRNGMSGSRKPRHTKFCRFVRQSCILLS